MGDNKAQEEGDVPRDVIACSTLEWLDNMQSNAAMPHGR